MYVGIIRGGPDHGQHGKLNPMPSSAAISVRVPLLDAKNHGSAATMLNLWMEQADLTWLMRNMMLPRFVYGVPRRPAGGVRDQCREAGSPGQSAR